MLRGLILDADGVLVLAGPMTRRRDWERLHGKPEGSLDAALSEAIGPGWAGGRGEEGLAKPDPALYTLTCHRLGLEPAECLFVDDAPANVAGARLAGLRAEVYSTVEHLRLTVTSAAPEGRSAASRPDC